MNHASRRTAGVGRPAARRRSRRSSSRRTKARTSASARGARRSGGGRPAEEVVEAAEQRRRVADPLRRDGQDVQRMLAETPRAATPAPVAAQQPVVAAHGAKLQRVAAGDVAAADLPPTQAGADLVDRVPAQQLRERGDLLPARAPVELGRAVDVVGRAAVAAARRPRRRRRAGARRSRGAGRCWSQCSTLASVGAVRRRSASSLATTSHESRADRPPTRRPRPRCRPPAGRAPARAVGDAPVGPSRARGRSPRRSRTSRRASRRPPAAPGPGGASAPRASASSSRRWRCLVEERDDDRDLQPPHGQPPPTSVLRGGHEPRARAGAGSRANVRSSAARGTGAGATRAGARQSSCRSGTT